MAAGAGAGFTLTILRTTLTLRCGHMLIAAATSPAKQSSRAEENSPATLTVLLPRESGEAASLPMTPASNGSTRLLVRETSEAQIAWASRNAITRRARLRGEVQVSGAGVEDEVSAILL